MTDPIRWGPGAPIKEPDASYLVVNPTEHVTMGLRLTEEGGWTLSFVTSVEDSVPLPVVEAFMLRIAGFIEREPVRRE